MLLLTSRVARRAHPLPLLVAALSLGACSSDFDPSSYLKDVRVLAVTSDKLEAGPGETVTLRPVLYAPPPSTVTKVEWSFCPLSLGATSAFDCVAPQCETALRTDADFGTSANPLALAAACFGSLSGDGGVAMGGAADGGGAGLTQVVDTLFRLRVTTSDGSVEEAVQRFPLYPFAAPTSRNRAPIITGVTVGGVVADGNGRFPAQSIAVPPTEVPIEVTVDAQSLDRYSDSGGVEFTEDPIVSYFATAGRFKQDRSSGVRGNVKWKAEKLEPTDTEVVLYVVARDLRGGETVAGPYRWALTSSP